MEKDRKANMIVTKDIREPKIPANFDFKNSSSFLNSRMYQFPIAAIKVPQNFLSDLEQQTILRNPKARNPKARYW